MQEADIMKIGTLADKWAIRRDSNACMSAQMELFDVNQIPCDEDGRETSNTTPPRKSITFTQVIIASYQTLINCSL
uniref:Uncharacterized protein n=1 Tax=Cucumis melo TaxID=3656 RepID=A0A9I9EI08_CUCME